MTIKVKPKTILLIFIIFLVIIIIGSGLYRVSQGEEALVVTFGRVTEKNGPGLYWKIPFVQTVLKESVTTIHTKEYGFRTTQQGSFGTAAKYIDVTNEGVMLTNDNSIVSLEAIYQYTIKDVKQYLFDVDDPEGTLQMAFEAVIRRNIQSRPLDDALLNKDEIERQVLPDFQRLIDGYQMGVKINDVRIQNITVPSEVSAAYEDVNNAKNEKSKRLDEAEKYKNEILPTARSSAYQLLQEAEAYKAETVAKALSEVSVFTFVYEKYAVSPDITRKRLMIETLETVLSNSGSVYIVDNDSSVTMLLDLTGKPADTLSAAALGGGE